MSLYKDGKVCEICKTCRYRLVFGGGKATVNYVNTLCSYNCETGKLRETEVTENHCDYYEPIYGGR